MKHTDVRIADHGSIVLFYTLSDASRAWWRDNVADGETLGAARVVEHRYAMDILQGLIRDGLSIAPAYGIGEK